MRLAPGGSKAFKLHHLPLDLLLLVKCEVTVQVSLEIWGSIYLPNMHFHFLSLTAPQFFYFKDAPHIRLF